VVEAEGASPSASATENTAAIARCLARGGVSVLRTAGTYLVTSLPRIPNGAALKLAPAVVLTDGTNALNGDCLLLGDDGGQGFIHRSMTLDQDKCFYLSGRNGSSLSVPSGVRYPLQFVAGRAAHLSGDGAWAYSNGHNLVSSGQGVFMGQDTDCAVNTGFDICFVLATDSHVYGSNTSCILLGASLTLETDANNAAGQTLVGWGMDVADFGRTLCLGRDIFVQGAGTDTSVFMGAVGRNLRFTVTDGFPWHVFGMEFRIGATTKITLPAGRGGVIVGMGPGGGFTRNELDFGTDGLTRYRGTALRPETNGVGRLGNNGAGWAGLFLDYTNTPPGTTGAVTINKPSGRVNIATGNLSVVVTNSLVTAASNIMAMVCNGAAVSVQRVVPAAGSFTIHLAAAAPAETAVSFFVVGAD
jgi:hypothetical protein